MVDWNSTAEISIDATALAWFMHVLLGVYSWEFVSTFKFDWGYITRRRKFQWPLAFYFANRYCLFLTLMGVMVAVNVTTPINCQALFVIVELCSHASIGFACINFAMRAVPLWGGNKWVTILLIILTLGHWSLILQAGFIDSTFHPNMGCLITQANAKIQTATFVYASVFDLVTLTLIMVKHPFRGPSTFSKILHHDSFLYILMALCFNCLATIFMHLDLNTMMASIFVFPSAVFSTISATRCIRRITKPPRGDLHFYSGQNSIVRFRGDTYTDHTFSEAMPQKSVLDSPHILMETLVTTEYEEVGPDHAKASDEESQVLPCESDCH